MARFILSLVVVLLTASNAFASGQIQQGSRVRTHLWHVEMSNCVGDVSQEVCNEVGYDPGKEFIVLAVEGEKVTLTPTDNGKPTKR